jgi:hypothetical protein
LSQSWLTWFHLDFLGYSNRLRINTLKSSVHILSFLRVDFFDFINLNDNNKEERKQSGNKIFCSKI